MRPTFAQFACEPTFFRCRFIAPGSLFTAAIFLEFVAFLLFGDVNAWTSCMNRKKSHFRLIIELVERLGLAVPIKLMKEAAAEE